MVQNLSPCEDFCFNIPSVMLDSRDSEFAFGLCQEEEAAVSLVWKVDHPPICQNSDNTRKLSRSAFYAYNR